ncbi:MAG: hypothetical protein A4S17_05175 [Proteobacteria bacterium HN_bin10]|jgi:hypothetical protein|nr:MAG: hypothetical protein A4S17_05175 [Proteobacteria bacterium HN_bin10]
MRWILLLLVIAGVAGYFTRPDEAAMRTSADAILQDPQSVSEGFESLGAAIAGERAYSNYYVASKYSVTLDGQPIVTCWGAFTQTQCNREADTRTGG